MEKRDLRAGDLIAFKIGTTPDFSAPNKDSWGVIKILDLGDPEDGSFSLCVKAGLWKSKPTWWQAMRAPLLIEKRFKKLGTNRLKPAPMIFSTPFDCVIDVCEPVVIGRAFWFSRVERDARRKFRKDGHCYSIAPLGHAAHGIDHEYRAAFDEDRWKSEIEAYKQKQDRLRKMREEREKKRLKAITVQTLLEEIQFQDWDNRMQIVPSKFTKDLRQRSKELLADLDTLGAKPKRKDVRGLLKAYVAWLNAFDGAFGYAIETEEREDIVAFLEELCWATKQKALVGEIDEWRDW